MKHLTATVFLVILVSAAGCGPVVSGVQIVSASAAVGAAETAGAPRTALYEYTAAQEYLHKAREEHGYSDFAASRLYADKAFDYAIRARKRAEATSQSEDAVLPEQPTAPAIQPVIVPTP